MIDYMFVLRSAEKTHKSVCPACVSRGEILDSCTICSGTAIKKYSFMQYYVQNKPIKIVRIDRDQKTGILRYWEGAYDFYYETTTPELNKYIPEVPYGVHLCHYTKESAETECARINKYLANKVMHLN